MSKEIIMLIKKARVLAQSLEPAALILLFIGIFVTPIYLRYPLLAPLIGYYGQINTFSVTGCAILLFESDSFGRKERIAAGIYLCMLFPLVLTDRLAGIRLSHTAATIFNCWLPFFLPLVHLQSRHSRKRIGVFLKAYNAFAVVLLAVAVWDRLSETKLLYHVANWFWNHSLYEYEEIRVMLRLIEEESHRKLSRFYFVWGHTLTNAIFFNGFFILNDIYYRCINAKYPRVLYFAVALTGTLLCGAKMAIIVLFVYLVVTNWEDKRWLAVYGLLTVIFYFSRAFDSVLRRFKRTSLTSGRFSAMKRFFSEGRYPLHFGTGYGGNSSRVAHTYLYDIRAAFEFPPLMFALDYGILFSTGMIGTFVLYNSNRMLRRSGMVCWLGIGLWYLQINTYYASSLNCHDAGWIMAVGVMLAVNCADLASGRQTASNKPVQQHGMGNDECREKLPHRQCFRKDRKHTNM